MGKDSRQAVTAQVVDKKSVLKNNYFDGLEVTVSHRAVFFTVMLAYFFEQVDNFNFGSIAPALVANWGITMQDIGSVTSMYFVGMTLGGIFGGMLSDLIGRRKTFLFSVLVFSMASVINGILPHFGWAFIMSRAMTGFGVFCLMICSQAYIAEMAPAESRGKWQGLVAAVGFSAIPFIGLACRMIVPMSPEAWRYIFYFGGTGLVAFLLGLKYLHESPRWLVAQGRVAEAEAICEKLTGRKIDLSEVAQKVEKRSSLTETVTGMFSRKYIVRTLVLMVTFICITPGNFVLSIWTPTLLKNLQYSLQDSLMAVVFINIGLPVGCYLSSVISDLGGRKIPLMCMMAASGILSLIFGHQTSYWVIVFIGFILTIFTTAQAFILASYTTESYPTKIRNSANGLHQAIARMSVAGTQVGIPLVYAAYGFVGVFTVMGSVLLVPIIFVLTWGLRTGGKSLEEIS